MQSPETLRLANAQAGQHPVYTSFSIATGEQSISTNSDASGLEIADVAMDAPVLAMIVRAFALLSCFELNAIQLKLESRIAALERDQGPGGTM